MVATVLYTDTDAIRGAIGTDEADIEDSIITGQNMDLQMAAELDGFLPGHATLVFSSIALENKLNLWCMWFGAWRLAQSPLATPKKLSTGKDEYERFNIDWDALKAVAYQKLCDAKDALITEAGLPEAEVVGISPFGKATPTYNPITGSGKRSQLTEGQC